VSKITHSQPFSTEITTYVALDVHKHSIVAGILPAHGGTPEVTQIENTDRAIRRFMMKLAGPSELAVCYEAGPCGYAPFRLITGMGIDCRVVAPSLIPVRPGERIKTDRRDAKKLVRLFRAGELTFVAVPTLEQEALRDLIRCREDLIQARRAARHRVAKHLLRYGHVFDEGKRSWTRLYVAWLRRQRLSEPLAQRALEHMCAHVDGLDAQIAAIESELEAIAQSPDWAPRVARLVCFRGFATLTALCLLAEIGDFRRFGTPRDLMSYLGLTPSEYSSGDSRHRGHITKAGNIHARKSLIEAAWHYRHPPRLSARSRATQRGLAPEIAARAWTCQIRLNHRYCDLVAHGKRSTIACVAVARELAGFIWAAMTDQPLREEACA
jgi:transposase